MNNTVIKFGTITSNEEWNGNILISDDVIIPSGITVVVKPNTNIRFLKKSQKTLFNKNYKLNYLIRKFNLCKEQYVNKIAIIVRGSFIVNGEKNKVIDIGNDCWNGIIYCAPHSILKMKNARIRYGFGIICDIGSKTPVINSCIIEQCCIGIVAFSRIIIKNSRFNYNDIGIICYKKSIIRDNDIIDNFNIGILLINSKQVFCFANNIFYNDIGIRIVESSFINLKNNVIEYCNIGTEVVAANNININSFFVYSSENISVLKNSFDIFISSVLLGYKGIQVYDFSEAFIEKTSFSNEECAICLRNASSTLCKESIVQNTAVSFFLADISNIVLKQNDIKVDKFLLIIVDDAYFTCLDNKISSYGNAILSIYSIPKLFFYNSSLNIRGLLIICVNYCDIVMNSCDIEMGGANELINKLFVKLYKSKVKLPYLGVQKTAKLNINNSQIQILSKFSVSGNSKICETEVCCEDFISERNSEIFLKNSTLNIKKDIELIGTCNISDNEINTKTTTIYNNSNVYLQNNKIKIKEGLNITGCCNIDNTEIECNSIQIQGEEYLEINGSSIETENSIFVNKKNSFVCNKTRIHSLDSCFNIIGHSNLSLTNVILISKKEYAIIAKNSNIICYFVTAFSCQGLSLSSNVICEIYDSSFNILFNFLNISNSCVNIKNLNIKTNILKNLFFINKLSKVIINNINFKFENNILFSQFLDCAFLFSLLDHSRLYIDSFRININVPNKITFLKAERESSFELKKVFVSGFYKFMYLKTLIFGNIDTCKIYTQSVILDMYQNSHINIINTEISNLENFKFIIEDNSNLSLNKVSIFGGAHIVISINSQVYITNNTVKINTQDHKIQQKPCFYVVNSYFNINSLELESNILKELFVINKASKVILNDIVCQFKCEKISSQILNSDSLFGLFGHSSLYVNSFKVDIDVSNKMGFLIGENESYFELKKVFVSGLYSFLYLKMLVLGNIDNCKIYTQSLIANMYQNSNINIINTELMNLENFKFVTEENSNLFLKNVNICGGQLFVMSKNSQIYVTNSTLRIDDKSCKIQKFASFDISNSYVNINNFQLVSNISKELFVINKASKVVLNNIDFKFECTNKNLQFSNNCSLFSLLGHSRLHIDSSKMDINAPNKICFLKSENESYFDFKKMIVSGLYKFLYMGMLSLGNIDNCKICTQSLIVSMYQNSNLNIINTELTNLESFKFITEDNSSLLLKNVSICGGQFIVMSKNSQACITNSTLRLKDKACKIQENACFKDSFSDWNIDGTSVSNYAFFLLDNANININSSNITIREMFAYCVNNSYLKVDNIRVASELNIPMLMLEDKTKVEIRDSKLDLYSLSYLKNYSNIIIEKCYITVKDFIMNAMGNSKVFIKNVLFNQKSNNKKAAFEILHNSSIYLKDSTFNNFHIGIKYENKNNINIEETKINSKIKMIFTNDKRFLFFTNPIQKNLLYKLQQLVLSTNNMFPLNKIYQFIYVLSINIYKYFINRKQVLSLYLRRGMLNNWIAGSSDIDYLSILVQTDINTEYNNIINIKKQYKKLKRIFLFYGENLIFTESELKFYLKYGGIRSKLLKNSKLLNGKKQDLTTDIVIDLKHKIDIVKEILNSYILLSNNYFYNIDIISDICFSKAATDILKYIEYFYNMRDLDKSRIDYLKEQSEDVTKKLYDILKNSNRLSDSDRYSIFKFVFSKMETLSKNFNKEIINDNITNIINIYKKDSIDLYDELKDYRKDIFLIALDDPGLAYIVINNFDGLNKISSIYKSAKENYCFYNTPILFFTENIYQMLLLSGFRNDPFEIYKQCNIKDKYYERRFYICTNYRFCCFSSEILKKLVITSLSEQAIQINEIDITKEFKDISPELYDILISFLKFYLYLKNGKIIKNFSSENIIKEYKKYNNKMSLSTILSLFEEDCELSDNEKIQKIVIFIKNLKYELMKNYG